MLMNRFGLFAAVAVCAWGGALLAQSGPPPAAALVDFRAEIKPILAESCLECHSQDKRKGGLSLATLRRRARRRPERRGRPARATAPAAC